MDSDFLEILTRHGCENTENFNFVSQYGPDKHWNINNLSDFWFDYCSKVYEKNLKGIVYKSSIAERVQEYMPIVVKMDLKFSNEKKMPEGGYYSDKFILDVIRCFQETIEEHIEISPTKYELYCVVLDNKEPVLIDKYLKLSVQLHFPLCKLESSLYANLILPSAVEKMKSSVVLTKLNQFPLNDYNDIFDFGSCSRSMTLYGSTRTPQDQKLYRNQIYNIITQQHVDAESGPTISLSDLPFDKHPHTSKFGKKNEEFYIPLLLSVNYWDTVCTQRSFTKPIGQTQTMSKAADDDNVGIFDELSPKLSISRYGERHYWLDIGKAIFNIFNGTEQGLKRWISLTEENDVFDAKDCVAEYYKFEGNTMSIKTIAWFVREDDPEFYKEWHKSKKLKSMGMAMTLSHNDIARCFYTFYWLDIMYKGKDWYEYKDHRWKRNKNCIGRLLSNEMKQEFDLYKISYSTPTVGLTTEDIYKKNADASMVKNVENLIKKLGDSPFKKNIIREAMEYFDTGCGLDENPELLGVSNGVIEVVKLPGSSGIKDYLIFREGKPEDYISKNAGIPLENYFNDSHPSVIKLNKYLSEVFVDNSLRHHFLKLSASKLKGRNEHKFFEIWTGDKGNNSKSMMIKLHEKTFGNYCIKIPSQVLTNKNKGSGPNPELAQAKGVRLAFIQETAETKAFQADFIKLATGGDSFYARNTFDDGGSIEALFKLILVCNVIARIDGADNATVERLKIMPYASEFVNDPPETEEERIRLKKFKKNTDFDCVINDMAKAFLWKIFHYYKIYREEGLTDPKYINGIVEHYWNNTDPYKQYIDECIVQVPDDPACSIGISDLYKNFKIWFSINFPQTLVNDRNVAKTRFIDKLGNVKGSRFYGIKFTDI
jgi:phage/plasmid-associated DNA primase